MSLYDGYKLVYLPDIHADTKPTEHGWSPILSNAAKACFNFCDYFKPDETVIGGDFIDFPELATQDPWNKISREGKRLIHDLTFGNQLLDKIDKFTKGKKVFMIGNHDARLAKYIAEHPELEGMVSLKHSLRLKERGYEVIEENRAYKVGHARYLHGWYFNLHHSKKTVTEMGDNVFYGHTHDVQAFTKINYEQMPIIGHSMGTLGDLDPEWRRGRPSRWVNAFGIFYFFKNGNFTFYNPIIINGKFMWEGKIFDGGK